MLKPKVNVGDSKDEITDVVILIDESDPYFNVLTTDTPSCLLPLLNAPIIYYTMLQLLKAKFRNFKIFCGIHRKKIKEFFRLVKFEDFIDGKCKIQLLNENVKTPADAIRYLDSKTFDKGFLLINGDIVTDIDYESVVKSFQQQKTKNSNVIMAHVLSTKLPEELRLCSRSANYIQIDKHTNSLISNEESIGTHDKKLNSILLDKMYDPEIYVCSNKIPLRFTDQMDCVTMDDMITTVISHAEVVPDEIQIIIVDQSCFRVRDLNTYSYVSKKLIRGMIKNLSPPSIFGDNIKITSASGKPLTNYTSCFINSKLADDYISSSSKFIGNVQIQNGTRIGDHCRLNDSIIGYNCKIGNNVTLRNCFLMSNVTIENNCTISDSFLCSGCVVNNNCLISEKCVVDYNFNVPTETKVEGRVLSKKEIEPFWDIVYLTKEKEQFLDDIEVDNEETDNTILFAQDLHLLVKEALEEDMLIDNLFIETNRLKHQHSLDIDDICFGIMNVFVNYFFKEPIADKFRVHFVQLITRYGSLITKFTGDNETRTVTCLEAVEEAACYNPEIMDKVLDIFFSLYDNNIVSESDILQWFNTSSLLSDSELKSKTKQIRDNLSKLITFFEEADEESD